MVIEEIRKIKSGKKELRHFGLIFVLVLGMIGCWLWWKESQWYGYLLGAAGAFLLPALFFPGMLKPLHKLWMTLGICMGWVVTGVLMIVLFYLVVTPIGLLMRLCGRDPLKRRFDREAESYWIPRDAGTADKKNYERQF